MLRDLEQHLRDRTREARQEAEASPHDLESAHRFLAAAKQFYAFERLVRLAGDLGAENVTMRECIANLESDEATGLRASDADLPSTRGKLLN